jgi:protease-4
MSSLGPWTDDEKKLILSSMESVYNTFVERVASGRHKRPEEIQPIAQGRVWVGSKAKELGLVDEIGGLDAALAEARKVAKVDPATPLEIYPPSPTLRDVLNGWGGGVSTAHLGLDATSELARVLDPAVAHAAEQLLALVLTFRTTHVQTLAIVPELE